MRYTIIIAILLGLLIAISVQGTYATAAPPPAAPRAAQAATAPRALPAAPPVSTAPTARAATTPGLAGGLTTPTGVQPQTGAGAFGGVPMGGNPGALGTNTVVGTAAPGIAPGNALAPPGAAGPGTTPGTSMQATSPQPIGGTGAISLEPGGDG